MEEALDIDLQETRELGVAIRLHLVNGEELLAGLHHLPEDEPWFSVFHHKTMSQWTTRKVFRDQVGSRVVTDIRYGYAE